MKEHQKGTFINWCETTLNVSYRTALRYMVFTCVVCRYPRILICGLSASQIAKHEKSLHEYLKHDKMLLDKLSISISIQVSPYVVTVNAAKNVCIPRVRLCTDPDAVFIEKELSKDEKYKNLVYECRIKEEIVDDETAELESSVSKMDVNKK